MLASHIPAAPQVLPRRPLKKARALRTDLYKLLNKVVLIL